MPNTIRSKVQQKQQCQEVPFDGICTFAIVHLEVAVPLDFRRVFRRTFLSSRHSSGRTIEQWPQINSIWSDIGLGMKVAQAGCTLKRFRHAQQIFMPLRVGERWNPRVQNLLSTNWSPTSIARKLSIRENKVHFCQVFAFPEIALQQFVKCQVDVCASISTPSLFSLNWHHLSFNSAFCCKNSLRSNPTRTD